MSVPLTINAQTGTSYAIQDIDRDSLITFNNSSAIAATIAQAGNTDSFFYSDAAFKAGWLCYLKNIGSGTVTLTPATSTIETAAKLIIPPGAKCCLYSDGTNYRLLDHDVDTTAGGGAFGTTNMDDQVIYPPALSIVSSDAAVIGLRVNLRKAHLVNKVIWFAATNWWQLRGHHGRGHECELPKVIPRGQWAELQCSAFQLGNTDHKRTCLRGC